MNIVLIVAALLPAAGLMIYVYTRDKIEREPIGLVARVFAFGALSGIVAALIEGIIIGGLEAIVPASFLLLFLEYFIGVAAVEEACKFFCLNTVKNNPAFNHVFDAIVYSVAAALGFAALENVFYVLDGGLETALLRAVLSVPGHAADGVVMGVFYGIARQHELYGNKRLSRRFYWLAFLLPVIEHGLYDAALATENDLMTLFAVLFDLAFIVIAFILVRRTAANDKPLHPLMRGAAPNGLVTPSAQTPMAGQPMARPWQQQGNQPYIQQWQPLGQRQQVQQQTQQWQPPQPQVWQVQRQQQGQERQQVQQQPAQQWQQTGPSQMPNQQGGFQQTQQQWQTGQQNQAQQVYPKQQEAQQRPPQAQSQRQQDQQWPRPRL